MKTLKTLFQKLKQRFWKFDKLKHFTLGMYIFTFSIFVLLWFMKVFDAFIISLIIVWMAGIGREVWNYFKGGQIEVDDLIATTFLPNLIILYIFIFY